MSNMNEKNKMLKSDVMKQEIEKLEQEIDSLNLNKLKLFAYIGERLLPKVYKNPIFEGTVRDIMICEKDIDNIKKEIREKKEDFELILKEERIEEERNALLQRVATCPNCLKINKPGDEYCEECGTWLGDISVK